MQALTFINEGRIDDAIQSATESVREAPSNTGFREILAELFCIRGDLERADKQTETIFLQQPQQAIRSSLLRQLIRAETSRRECWLKGRVPEFIGEPDEVCRISLSALVALRSGNPQEAVAILAEIENQIPERSGVCNGKPFSGFRDLDDYCQGIVEVLTSTGKYFWVPTTRVNSMQFDPVTRPRDLLWRQCQMSVEGGPNGVVYIPAIYLFAEASGTAEERLGRVTNWSEPEDEPVRGSGQRTYLIGEDEMGIMELENIEFS
jgi:type VI secretion system protein ImpE